MQVAKNYNRITRPSLPYLNNLRSIFITVIANFLLVLAFNFKMVHYNVYTLALDAIICGMLTAIIDVLIVYFGVKKAWRKGTVPEEVPTNSFIMRLPKHPALLMIVFGFIASIVCVMINCGLFLFYGFTYWSFWQFMFYKLAYSLLLSQWLVSLSIFRMVQKDFNPEFSAGNL
jgi:hypothetical protein